MANRGKEFVKDVGIYAIGNIGSKLITFFMVPLYTHYVSDISDFGYYDICLSAILLLLPIVTLQLRDGVFRFLVDAKDDVERKQAVLLAVYKTLATTLAVSVGIVLFVSIFWEVKYIWLSWGLMCLMALYEVISQAARGIGDAKVFVASGIISSFGVGVFSILCVVVLDGGVPGIFVANILARLVAVVYIEIKLGIFGKYLVPAVKTCGVSSSLLREVLKYSTPLIFVSMYWWLTNCSDRFFIAHYLGLRSNGIYSVAVRFTSILQTFGLIFYQAWQDSAFHQYNSPDRNRFFSSVFNGYIFVLAVILLVYTFGLKIIYPWLVDSGYRESIAYLYPLGVSALLYTMVQFTNIIYQCALDTYSTLPQMVAISTINIVLNFVLIRWLGVYGVIATSIISYLVLLLYRSFDMRRYVKLKIAPAVAVPIVVAVLGGIPFYLNTSAALDIAFVVVSAVVMYIALPRQFKDKLLSRIRRC